MYTKFSIVDSRLNNLISVSGRAMQRAVRAASVAYDGPIGAVPPVRWPGSHLGRLRQLHPLPAAFLIALVVELPPCGLGPQKWGGGESQSLRPGHADDGALVWGRTRIGM